MRKLFWFAFGFLGACLLAGYLVAREYYLPAVVAGSVLLALSLLAMLKWKQARYPAVILLGLVVGFSWIFLHDEITLSAVRASDRQAKHLEVMALEDPETTQYGTMVLVLARIDGRPCQARAYLSDKVQVQMGDTLQGTFRVSSTLVGGKGDSSYLRSNQIFMTLSGEENITVTRPEHLPILCWPAYAKELLLFTVDSLFSADTAAYAKALLLGDTEGLDYETYSDLKTSGIAHVIAVSGMHVTILFGLIYFLTGRRRLLVVLLGFPLLLFFAAMVGFSPSITRACLMNALMMLGLLFNKEYDSFTSLGFAVLVMLLMNPYTATSVSFQLSVACMAGMFLFTEPIVNWLMDRKRLGKWKKLRKPLHSFSLSVGISLGATIATTPLCAIYFGTVSIVGLLTNLLTLWVITYVFYGIMAACALGAVYVPLGMVAAWVTSCGIRFVQWIVSVLADFPVAAVYTQSKYVVFWLIFCYFLLGAYLHMQKKRPAVFACCAALGLCLALFVSWYEPLTDDCRVTVLDVGQGQCVLLQSEGKNYLVDCGGDSDTQTADRAAGFLLSQGISRLDGVILTHFDRDHAGALAYLLTRVPTDRLFLPNTADEDALSEELLTYEGGAVQRVESLTQILFGPVKITLIPSKRAEVDNESGLCVLFQRENCDILITGDRSAEGELELMESIDLPKLELLVAGHHGSKHSTSQALLEATRPETVVISVGADNPYGHPSREVLERLMYFGCILYRTDENGTVVFRG